MEYTTGRGDFRKPVKYLETLRWTAKELHKEVTMQEQVRTVQWLETEEEFQKQLAIIDHMNKHKRNLILKLNQLKLLDLDEERNLNNPIPCSTRAYDQLQDQIRELELQKSRLEIQINDTRHSFFEMRRQVPLVELCNQKYNQTTAKSRHKENDLTGLWKTFEDIRTSCKEFHSLINSMMESRYVFYKKRKAVRWLIAHGKEYIEQVVDGSIMDHQKHDNVVKCKFALIRERLVVDRKKIAKNLSELRSVVEKIPLSIKRPSEVSVGSSKSEFDPFLPEFDNLSYAEKRIRCDVILSRIQNVSGAEDILTICRAYSENEMMNRKFYGGTEETLAETEELLNAIRMLRVNIRHAKEQKLENSQKQPNLEMDKLMENINTLRREAIKIEGLVDEKDSELNRITRMLYKMLESCAWTDFKDDLLGMSSNEHLDYYLKNLKNRIMDMIRCLVYLYKQSVVEHAS